MAAKTIPLYLNRSQRLGSVAVLLMLLALPLGLSLYGWYFHDLQTLAFLTGFGVFVSGGTLLLMRKVFRIRKSPVFTITSDGVEIEAGNLLHWGVFEKVLVFRYEGEKMIGLQSKEALSLSEKNSLNAACKCNITSQMLNLPLAVPYDGFTLPGQEIVEHFRKNGLGISVIESEIRFGQESMIHTVTPNNS